MASAREAGMPGAAGRGASNTLATETAERLKEIIAEAAAPEDALEPALRCLVEAMGGAGGAICFFDQRKELLRLAAETGLSDDGCRRLRSVRRGDMAGWDMPLHGLLNRRAYLIDSAAKNRYVPPLVDPPTSVRSIVCLPLYQGATPLGSLLIVTTGLRLLTERDIHNLGPSVRELSALIEAIRLRAAVAAPAAEPRPRPPEPPAASPTVPPTAGPTVPPVAAGPSAPPPRPMVSPSAPAAAPSAGVAPAAPVRHDRLAERIVELGERAATSALTTEIVELRARLEQIESRARDEVVEAEQLRARVAQAEAVARAEAERAAEWARKVEEVAAALEQALSREEALRAELDAARPAERELRARVAELEAAAAEAGRVAELSAKLAAAEERATAEGSRAAEVAERLAATEARAATLEAELAKRPDGDAVGAAQARITALEEELASARRVAEEVTARLAAAEERAAAVPTLERDLAEHREAADALQRTVAELEARLAERGAAGEQERAGAEDARAELAAAHEVVQSLKAEIADLRKRLEGFEAAAHAVPALERDLRTSREREAAARARVAELEAECAKLREAPAPTAAAAPAPPAPAAAKDASAAPAAPPPAAASGRKPAAPPPPAAASRPAAKRGAVVVIDTNGGWKPLAATGALRVVAPDDALARNLDAAPDGRVLVNLAAPGVLHAIARLRAAGCARRFWACLAPPDAERALPLGMVEPATRPLAPEALVAALSGYAARGTRVVTLGRDVDAFVGFRQGMAKQGLSVSMAWDAKQAADLIVMVRPEVAVVDLESLREGCAIIASMAGGEPLPHLVLLLGAKDPAQGFALALRDPAHASRMVPLDKLVADACQRSEERPAERR